MRRRDDIVHVAEGDAKRFHAFEIGNEHGEADPRQRIRDASAQFN